jgi:hypothetical protein
MGANVMVSQKLKSLRRIMVRNGEFLETSFFVVCDDIWIAIYPPCCCSDFPLRHWPCILGIQPIAMFCLTITLHESGGTTYVVIRIPIIIPQQVS